MLPFSALVAVPFPSSLSAHTTVAADNLICGAFGGTHIQRPDGRTRVHGGHGEYQLLSLPLLSVEAHFYGCGLPPLDNATRYDVRVPHNNHSRAFADGRSIAGTWSLIC